MGSEAARDVRLGLYRGTWCAIWREPGKGTQRRSLRTKDRGTAEQALVDFRNSLAAIAGGTVAEIMAAYLEEKSSTAQSASRLKDAWKRLQPAFGHLRPDQIDRALCRAYAERRRKDGVRPGTIIKELSTLRAGLTWHDKNTPAVFELPSAPPPRERFLTREEAKALIGGCDAPHIRLFVILALTTAARKEAILDLTWDRVDFDRGLIRLWVGEGRRKGRATVPMHDLARPHLIKAKQAALTDRVIEYAGREEGVGSIRRGFSAACARAGLSGVTPHVLRHTAAVWMAESGVPLSEIGAFLGHTDERATRVYAKYSPDYLRRAAGAISW